MNEDNEVPAQSTGVEVKGKGPSGAPEKKNDMREEGERGREEAKPPRSETPRKKASS